MQAVIPIRDWCRACVCHALFRCGAGGGEMICWRRQARCFCILRFSFYVDAI